MNIKAWNRTRIRIIYIFLTNNANPIKKDINDRRFCGIECNTLICNNVDYFNSSNNKGATHTINLEKYTNEDLIKQIQNFKENYKPMTINKKIPKSLFIPEIPEEEKIIPLTQKSRKGRKPIKNYKHAFLNN